MIHPVSPVHTLLAANARWAESVDRTDPGFFERSAKGQYPKACPRLRFAPQADNPPAQVLWIGCADSRVPESLITGARPGDVFVHRNIAKYVSIRMYPSASLTPHIAKSTLTMTAHSLSSLSQSTSPAWNMVRCAHMPIPSPTLTRSLVIIAGHTQCGGASACYQAATAPTASTPSTPLARWLTPLTKLVASLDLSTTAPEHVLDRIVHENVKRQVDHVCDAEPVKQAWAAGKHITVHGWVYDLASGRIKDLGISRGPSGPL